MKRVILISLMIMLGLYGCEKEKEGIAKFVIGNWESQELTLETMSEGQPSPVGHYIISINADDTYTLKFEGIDCGAGKYTITGDKIYLNKFIRDPLYNTTPEPATFTVIWVPGETQMTWTGLTTDLIWTKL